MTVRSERPYPMTVAVTGASGFIGARIVEILESPGSPYRARVLSRRRTASRDGSVVKLDEEAAVRAAFEGCSAVIHCAFDYFDMASNVVIGRTVARACAAVGARLVHVSTAAVYEPFPDGVLDERSRVPDAGPDYKRVKLAIENELISLVGTIGLDVVILQPTVVYGPMGRAWTDSPVRELLTGTVVLPARGGGLCNAVFVDDVCDAMISAMTAEVPSGETILISGPRPVAWRDFYGAYQEMLGVDALECDEMATGELVSPDDAASGATVHMNAWLKRMIVRIIGMQGLSQLNMWTSQLRSRLAGHKVHAPTGPKLALMRAHCHVRIDKARRLLGYAPQFDLQQGMQMTASYVMRTYGGAARRRAKRERSDRVAQSVEA